MELPQIDPRAAIEPYLNALSQCESGGRTDIKVLDVNGYYSYGKYQYQLLTWRRYGIKFGYWDNTITDTELRTHIYKEWLQDDMTARILLTEKNGWRNWVTCGKKAGLDKLAGDTF